MDEIRVDAAAVLSTLLVVLILHISIVVLKYRQRLETPEELRILATIKDAQARISKLSKVADFVEVSKLERSIVKSEKELAALKVGREKPASTVNAAGFVEDSRVRYMLFGLLVLAYWSTPIATIPARLIGPAAWPLSFPGWPRGTIGIIPWIGLLNSVVGTSVTSVGRSLGFVPQPPAGGFLGGLMQQAMGFLGKR